MGTMIQTHALAENDFRGRAYANHPRELRGCNDLLAVTQPAIIAGIHRAFLLAARQLGPLTFASSANGASGTAKSSSCTTEVVGVPAILLEVVDVEDPVEVGKEAVYDIKVTNQGSAIGTNIRISPRKLNLVAQSIRGLRAEAALNELSFSQKRVAGQVKKVLQSAIANVTPASILAEQHRKMAEPGSAKGADQ